ncbi:hypothetical protein J27TS7_58220 [Paenibacillus dendritiformis]|nr:hypothetical protein J27TS7_58220 [Paenibacillus dendritiformis]
MTYRDGNESIGVRRIPFPSLPLLPAIFSFIIPDYKWWGTGWESGRVYAVSHICQRNFWMSESEMIHHLDPPVVY